MADYFFPTVIQPTIPCTATTALERLILERVFDSEPDGDGLYFFAEVSPNDLVDLSVTDAQAGLAASADPDSAAVTIAREALEEADGDDTFITLDLTVTSWEHIFQDIVRRSPALHVTAVSAFTCSKMRPDGFGGLAILITADAVSARNTDDILKDMLEAAEHGPLACARGFGTHVLLSLTEAEIRAEISAIREADDAMAQFPVDAVSDVDIRAACCHAVEHTDLAEERGAAIHRTALAAICEAEQRRANGG
jgi:hypothetical protein